jgi:diguanylate cyclase (GGDEF)-like protein
MNTVSADAGRAFDPQVVKVLEQHYGAWEQMAQAEPNGHPHPTSVLQVEHGGAPAAGFERLAQPANGNGSAEFLSLIAAARQEVQMLYELTSDLGSSLSLDETLSVLALRLGRLIPYDTLAVYLLRDGRLVPEYVTGDSFRLFSALEIPVGEGLSGWVARHARPIVNGNPSVEPAYLGDASRQTALRSALAVPLEGSTTIIGVVTLYHSSQDAFSKDHLRILMAASSKLALSIENALKFRQMERAATADDLSGLPNTKSLFVHLDGELARARRTGQPLALLVCDVDGLKRVGELYGQAAMETLVREVAHAIRSTCREYDYAARIGGGEFVLVLPGLKPDGVRAVVRRLDQVVREITGASSWQDCPLAVDFGEAFCPDDGVDAEELLAEADRRLYKARNWNRTETPKADPAGVRSE